MTGWSLPSIWPDDEARFEPEKLEQRARKTIDEEGRVNLQSVPQLKKTAPEQTYNLPAAAIAPERASGADRASEMQFADTDSFEVRDAPILEEANALARVQEGKNKASELGALSSSMVFLARSNR